MSNVVEFLKQFRESGNQRQIAGSQIEETDRYLNMTAEEFSQEEAAILIHSYLFGENFYLIANERSREIAGDSLAVYLPEELVAVSKLSPEAMKRIHNLKKKTQGTIVGIGTLKDEKDVRG